MLAVARRAVLAVWSRRAPVTNLLGSVVDMKTGLWLDATAGIGAGLDSFYEYLFKVRLFSIFIFQFCRPIL